MGGDKMALPQGTLDLLILRTLALEPQHGWAISERVQQLSSDVLQIPQGSLYPALHRLERSGSIRAQWGTSDSNRRASTTSSRHAAASGCKRDRAPGEDDLAAVASVLQHA